jgi:6-phosphogluconolactonase/glucosamine-6-phosphate isomerase/deaminase
MQTYISVDAHKKAGEYITTIFKAHKDTPILFLVSGGSALSVLESIDAHTLGEHIAIGLVDERFTHNTATRNREALMQSSFFRALQEHGGHCIVPEQKEGDSHDAYTAALDAALETHIQTHGNLFVCGLFGIGEDGHTASIFPTTQQMFRDAYLKDTSYVAIAEPKLPEPFRVSLTPTFIEEKIDEVVLYAVGSTKCDNILSYMHTKNFADHEIPALIPARHQKSSLFTDCEALS